jgi:hypothetical protein
MHPLLQNIYFVNFQNTNMIKNTSTSTPVIKSGSFARDETMAKINEVAVVIPIAVFASILSPSSSYIAAHRSGVVYNLF